MTKEEYQIKIDKLRKERDFHKEEYERCLKEIDALFLLNSKERYNEMPKGEYIVRNFTTYKRYFHATSWEEMARGAMMYGGGFYMAPDGIKLTNSEQILYEDNPEDYKISIITKEEYDKAFENMLEEFRNYKNKEL